MDLNMMSQLGEIYVNALNPSCKLTNKLTAAKSSENINANEDEEIHCLQPKRTGSALSDTGNNEKIKRSSCRAAAVCLALLCLLLLAGIIAAVIQFTKVKSDWEMEMTRLQTSYNNMTSEKDQLRASYNNLTKERDRLQTSYNNLTKERDQLQMSYSSLTEERDKMQKIHEAMSKDRDDLQRMLQEIRSYVEWVKSGSSFYYISTEEKNWTESRKDCQRRGADLVIINSEEEQNFLIQLKKEAWIGLTHQDEEGEWKWVNGTALTTSYDPQFDNSGGEEHEDEDCAEISPNHPNPLNKWNDTSCLLKKNWICEIMI